MNMESAEAGGSANWKANLQSQQKEVIMVSNDAAGTRRVEMRVYGSLGGHPSNLVCKKEPTDPKLSKHD